MKKINLLSLSFLSVLIYSCYKESDYNKPVDEGLYKIAMDKGTIPADGFSTVKIVVEIPGDADEAYSKIVFTTTAGIFVDGNTKTVTVTAKKLTDRNIKLAEAVLRSSVKLETADITVELFNLRKNVTVKFINAYPENLELISSSLSIKPLNNSGGEVNLDGFITKVQGFPSVGNIVNLIAFDSVFNNQIGSFRVYNNQSNENGKTNFVFVLGDSIANNAPAAYIGKLYLVAKALKNEQNQFVADTIKLISSR